MGNLFHTFDYQPIYNGLIFFINHLPWNDLGLDIIVFTLLVRLVLAPLSLKVVRTQQQTKLIQPELDAIKKRHKNDRNAQAMATMELYKKHKISPFSGLLILLIQLPIIWGLYRVFLHSGLPTIDTSLLYSFIQVPSEINIHFLGLIDITEKSFILALAAAVLQYIQTKLLIPVPPKRSADGKEPDMKEEFTRVMAMQMKFIFPIIIFFIAYHLTGAIALYLATGSVFQIAQELYVRKHIRSKTEPEPAK